MSKRSLQKLVKQLTSIKGRHTELVTVYIPAGYSIHETMATLRNEQSTAENIKSKPVRKNVTSALEKIMRHLTLYKKTPEHGVALFCGNVSENDAKVDIELWAIEPPEPIKTKMYWCDQRFVLDPLKEMITDKDIYGIINLDKSEANVALLIGKKIENLAHFESIVPGKSRAGGQSSARFARVREGMLNDWLKRVGETSNKAFGERKGLIGIIVSGPGPIKDYFLKDDYLHTRVKDKVIGTVDTSYTGQHGLDETLERGEDLIKELGVTKEKNLLQKFFTDMQRPGGNVAYGFADVLKALELGAVETIVISDRLNMKVQTYKDEKDEDVVIATGPIGQQEKDEKKKDTKNLTFVTEEDLDDFFERRAKDFGSKVEIVSADTREGLQFYHFGGIGAFLRYKI